MFLLSKVLIERYCDRDRIRISPMGGAKEFGDTFYYFHLDPTVRIRDGQRWNPVDIGEHGIAVQPGAHVRIASYEHIALSSNVMAQIGANTDLVVHQGLYLLHGPTVDPSWAGKLELALVNLSGVEQTLTREMRIGKLLFYDVSDTALEEGAPGKARQGRMGRWDDFDADEARQGH